jgi:hypothetical protein
MTECRLIGLDIEGYKGWGGVAEQSPLNEGGEESQARGRGRKPRVPALCIRIRHGQIAEPLLPGIQRQTPVVEQL